MTALASVSYAFKPAQSSLRFSGLISKDLLEQSNDFVNSLPLHGIDQPIQLLELGSKSLRAIIIQPDGKSSWFADYPVKLGETLSKKQGKITNKALSQLEKVLKQVTWDLPNGASLANFDCVATASLRDAANADDVKHLLKQYGLNHTIILDEITEATHSYMGALRNQPMQMAHQKNLVLDLSNGSTKIVMGTGAHYMDPELSKVVPLGSDRIHLINPFNPGNIGMSRAYINYALDEQSLDSIKEAAQSRQVYLANSPVWRVFAALHKQKTTEDLFKQPIKLALVENYLEPAGLETLHRYYKAEKNIKDELIYNIPHKLLLLSVLMRRLGLTEVHLADDSATRAGLCMTIIDQQVRRRIQPVAEHLAEKARLALPKMIEQCKEALGDLFDKLTYRAKKQSSIADKLTDWNLRPGLKIKPFDPEVAKKYVLDTIGLRLTLPGEVSQSDIKTALNKLFLTGPFIATHATNYVSDKKELPPYVESRVLKQLVETSSKKDLSYSNTASKVKPNFSERTKDNGYIASQINFTMPSLGLCGELQIKGDKLQRISEIEHLFYDVREGKRIATDNKDLDTLVKSLKTAILAMDPGLFTAYTNYLAECYRVARQRELNQPAFYPPLPKGIDPLLEINHMDMIQQQLSFLAKQADTFATTPVASSP